MKSAWLILGNQLFPEHLTKKSCPPLVFMAEDFYLCTHFKYHKHKIILFLAAMRRYKRELERLGSCVRYFPLEPRNTHLSYEDKLATFIKENQVEKLFCFEVEDKFMEQRLLDFCKKLKIHFEVKPSPMFLTSRGEFGNYLKSTKKPFMKTFYERQRKRLNVLVDSKGQPMGGKWSFDTENRKPLTKQVTPPALLRFPASKEVKEVSALVDKIFEKHPGHTSDFWLPTSREEALLWLDSFIQDRLALFGDYEDAIPQNSDFVYHSVLTPLLNLGLITPQEVLDKVLNKTITKKIPLNSLEGFIRQIIGWREFIRGIYQNFSERQDAGNFWNHQRKLSPHWYKGTTGLEPLDYSIQKSLRLGYAHHIERLMILGNFMLLCEVHPQEAHRWFMEMFVDSSDWVMGPNVFGMALFSDGGIFSTKPYFCGSNYLLKMGKFKKGPWCDVADGLFWGFIEKHQQFFLKNPRLSMMARSLSKMDKKRLTTIKKAAEEFKSRVCPL